MKSDWEEVGHNTYWKPRAGIVFESLVYPGSWCGQVIGASARYYGTKEAAMQAVDAADKTEEPPALTDFMHPEVQAAARRAHGSVMVTPTMTGLDEHRYTDSTPNFRLIGLTGPARSGKDSVADILQEHGFARYALAKPLKVALRAMFNLTGEHTDGALKETPIPFLDGATPRKLMQTLGTEWGRRHIDDDVWLWLADEQQKIAMEWGYPGMVITDVRFDNEAQFIRDLGGEVWHISRPDVEAVSEHVSENGVSYRDGDSIIANTSTRSVLRDLVEAKL